MPTTSDVTDALARVTDALPGGGEERPGQVRMAELVAAAIDEERHLVVQAGTGTGKSLAYLVPAVLSGERVVVATATKALQDQLADKDLPHLADHLGQSFRLAVLKGRSNYVCLQRIGEVTSDQGDQLALDGLVELAPRDQLAKLVVWAAETTSGDRAELDFEPSPAAWAAVSVGARECPGRTRCPSGDECFTERARQEAAAADVVVVNTHLYGLDLASDAEILPEHTVVVIDEAHQLEDVISATAGIDLAESRFRTLARSVRAVAADDELIGGVQAAGETLSAALADHVDRRLASPLEQVIADALVAGQTRLTEVLDALRPIADDAPGGAGARKQRAMQLVTALAEDVGAALEVPDSHVSWVEGPADRPTLRIAPVDVSDLLTPTLWAERTAVLTSATIPGSLPLRLGLPDGTFEGEDVGSPFDFEHHALLYCAAHLPEPRVDGYRDQMHDELAALVEAAGGRTLALFTSWRAMDAAAEALGDRLDLPLLTQRELPKPALLEAFAGDERTSLLATMGFWQGVDVPGPTLSLVTIDRLPFPRPDDPLLQARRERAGAAAFGTVDLPRAATMLAQGVGRLIRTAEDRGVVAILDSRLATARYRWDIVGALPPMARTRHRDEVVEFLGATVG